MKPSTILLAIPGLIICLPILLVIWIIGKFTSATFTVIEQITKEWK